MITEGMDREIDINVTLTVEEATALYAFIHRAGFADYRANASCDEQARAMINAGVSIGAALIRAADENGVYL